MKLYAEAKQYKLYHGNMLDMLEVIQPNSIDSIVTDPPYELNFMGKGWDNSGIAFNKEAWLKCYEVLKPGGYLLAFGGTRTYHRIACAIEDAGFEIRDCIMWLYGSGFPKSLDISKAIDKKGGNNLSLQFAIDLKKARVEKKLTKKHCDAKYCNGSTNWAWYEGRNQTQRIPDYKTYLKICNEFPELLKYKHLIKECKREVISTIKRTKGVGIPKCEKEIDRSEYNYNITKPTSYFAKQWQGWGTSLKPAYEPIIVARKPFKGSVAENIMNYGVGGINIDECRIATDELKTQKSGNTSLMGGLRNDDTNGDYECIPNELGRFPSNVIHDGSEEAIKDMNINENDASRYFKCCELTNKDQEEDIWKNLNVSIAERHFMILKAIKECIAQMNVEDSQKKKQDQNVRFVVNLLDLCETLIVQENAKIENLDFKKEELQVIQDFITDYEKCTQLQNLVQYVESKVNIDIIQIMMNLLKLYGYVKVAITNNTLQSEEIENKRYLYTSKASKKDRDEGLDMFDKMQVNDGRKTSIDNAFQRGDTLRKNIHPTVKPVELMQYLVRLVTPKNGTILDCFMGSGSTGKATMFENRERNANYKFIGIELTEEYLPICEARIEYAINKYEYDFQKELIESAKEGQLNLFELGVD